jgi:Na+-translocating ferredoxin:NAD+ oxidoreductase RNF subunit RnfB
MEFIVPILTVMILAVLLGVCIVYVSKKFYVYEDPKIEAITKLLPGVNCGACGYPSCSALASALVETRDPNKTCPVGGADTAASVGAMLGIKMSESSPMVAVIRCQGSEGKVKRTAEYKGIYDCWAAKQTYIGPKACPAACVGFGACVHACAYGALSIVNDLARVDEGRCVGCGACVEHCPMLCIEMHERKEKMLLVACQSHEKGAWTKEFCSIGCIGCNRCVKECEFSAIEVKDFCAVIDQSKCTSCDKCFAVCPTHSIVYVKNAKMVDKLDQNAGKRE